MLSEVVYTVQKFNHALKEGWLFFYSVITHTEHLRNMLGPILTHGQGKLTARPKLFQVY